MVMDQFNLFGIPPKFKKQNTKQSKQIKTTQNKQNKNKNKKKKNPKTKTNNNNCILRKN